MQKFVLFAILISLWMNTFAQNPIRAKKTNALVVNLGGEGLLYSLQYEKYSSISREVFGAFALGGGYFHSLGNSSRNSSVTTLPHRYTINIGAGTNFFELGLAGNYFFGETDTNIAREKISGYMFGPLAGYRFMNKHQLLLRAYVNPMIQFSGNLFLSKHRIVPYGGVSAGYYF